MDLFNLENMYTHTNTHFTYIYTPMSYQIYSLYYLEQGKRRKSLYIWKQKENDKSFLVFDQLTIDF